MALIWACGFFVAAVISFSAGSVSLLLRDEPMHIFAAYVALSSTFSQAGIRKLDRPSRLDHDARR